MKKAPYTNFGKTVMASVVTYTNGIKDDPPKDDWDLDIYIESASDWYVLDSFKGTGKVVRVVTRD